MVNLLALIPAIGNILNKIIPDPNERERIKAEMTKEMLNAEGEFYKAAGSIITAEAQGESWMQRNWRPITMLTFVFIIANNYIIVPYVTWFSSMMFARGWVDSVVAVPTLDIPDGLWGLLQIGIGGYIGSRGVEKVVKKVQEGGMPLIGRKEDPRVAEDMRQMREDQRELLTKLRQADARG